MGLNRRRFLRQTVNVPVYVTLGSASAGLLYNLSEGGLAVDIMGPPLGGESVGLSFGLPGTAPRIQVNGQLAWQDEGGTRAGLRFMDLPAASRQQIKGWLSLRAVPEELEEAIASAPETPEPEPPKTSFTLLEVTQQAAQAVAEATVKREPGDSPVLTYGDIRPTSPAPSGPRDADLRGLDPADEIVADVRSALFQAVEAREAAHAPLTPQQLAQRRQRMRKLVLAGASGALAGLAIVVSIFFLRAYREQIFTELSDVKRTVAGLFATSNSVAPRVAIPRLEETKSRPHRRTESKGDPMASSAPGKAQQAKPFQVEVADPENRRYVVTPRGSTNIRVRFQGPTWKQGATPGAAGLESKPTAASAVGANAPVTSQGRISQQATGDVPTQQVMPSYPLLALQKNVQGTVVLQATIGKDGSVQSVRLISGHPVLATAVMDAVKQWRYKPVYRDGEPVEVQRRITVDFIISTD